MILQFDKLTAPERQTLYKAPVLMSLLAAGAPGDASHIHKEAIKLAHLRTFTANPVLREYYSNVEKNFNEEFDNAVKKFAPFDPPKRDQLKQEINNISHIIGKLDKDYAKELSGSLESYAKHVKNSTHSVFQDIIFPVVYSRL